MLSRPSHTGHTPFGDNGAADTVTALAFTQADELIDFIKNNSEL
jgi:hypothetical protein